MPRQISEERTRKEMIDPQLEKAGWYLRDHSKVKIEIPVDGYDAEPWNGVTDYCLYRENGEVLAVVEAKKTVVDVRLAEAQLEYYVREIEKHQSFRPFGFLANGYDIYFVEVGFAAKRLVNGFFTRQDLENQLFIRQNGKPLGAIEINNTIVDRAYQHEAIRRVSEAFEKGKRKALIVMATGTGKTRTIMGLIDVFMRANQARRILFVADRDELVKQAKSDGFEQFLPNEPCTRLYSWDVDTSKRLYAVTLQTLSNIFEQFSPAFFDLIIFDEVHRSIFNRYSEILQYFDGRMIGLTATPASYIDRDTFEAFGCHDDKPTYLYTYEQAIKEKYLVDYNLYAAQTRFQREGLHAANLTEEERNLLIQHGLDPDEINYEGTELEQQVTVTDMLRRQWQEIMDVVYKDSSGQYPGKTIVFAMTQKHALRLEEAFNQVFPQFPGMARVITYKSNYRSTYLKAFKKEDQPRIAISVDMLDTGVDIPEVTNLVFMKPVGSPIKLQQMIGRGTRIQAACRKLELLPNFEKKEFLIIDFWENNFSRDAKEAPDNTTPVMVRVFNTRLNLLETYLDDQQNPECQGVIRDLRLMIARIPTESLLVKRLMPEIEDVWQDGFWNYLLISSIKKLREKVGPHLRYAADVDVAAETFISKMERLKLARRTGKDTSEIAQSLAEDVMRLSENILDKRQIDLRRKCIPPTLEKASFNELNEIRDGLAREMKNKSSREDPLVIDYLRDFIAVRGYIMLTKRGEQMYVEEYRRLVEKRILDLVASHPTVQAIQRGESVTDEQLLELERALHRELGEGDLEVSSENIRKAYGGLKVDSFLAFARQVLELDALPDYHDVVQRQFESYITQHQYNADQIRFLRAVQSVFLEKRKLETADLYEPPLTNFGADAVEKWFSEKEVTEMVEFANRLVV
jgi:type I restriction enzyme R subunit